MVLPDTSVWIDYSRRADRGDAADLARLLDRGSVATCGPVVSELLAGAEGEVEARMWEMLQSLPWANLSSDSWRRVAVIARGLRSDGATVALTDLCIAVATVEAGYALWTFDSDFRRITDVLPDLKLYSPV